MRSWVSLQGVRISGFGPGTTRVLLLRFQGDAHWARCGNRHRSRCDMRHPDGPLHVEGLFSEVLHEL